MVSELRRKELGDFLWHARARLQAAEVGLPDQPRRRVPGLRREEVALLAGVSPSWYRDLEQARDIHVSRDVLEAIARALRLGPAGTGHILELAAEPERLQPPRSDPVTPELQLVLDSCSMPAHIYDRHWDIVAWNDAICRLFYATFPPGEGLNRNLLWRLFNTSYMENRDELIGEMLAQFRAYAARHIDDAWLHELLSLLSSHFPDFQKLWERHEVMERNPRIITMIHRDVGRLRLQHIEFELSENRGLHLSLNVPTDDLSREKLARLLSLS